MVESIGAVITRVHANMQTPHIPKPRKTTWLVDVTEGHYSHPSRIYNNEQDALCFMASSEMRGYEARLTVVN